MQQGVNIFEKRWIFFPIHATAHWFLVVCRCISLSVSVFIVHQLYPTGSGCAIKAAI